MQETYPTVIYCEKKWHLKINRLFWSEVSSAKIYSLKINEAGSEKRDTSQQKQSTQQF